MAKEVHSDRKMEKKEINAIIKKLESLLYKNVHHSPVQHNCQKCAIDIQIMKIKEYVKGTFD